MDILQYAMLILIALFLLRSYKDTFFVISENLALKEIKSGRSLYILWQVIRNPTPCCTFGRRGHSSAQGSESVNT